MIFFILLLAGCLSSVEEGSKVAAMAEYGKEHCGNESGDPRSCWIQGWFAGNSGEVGIFTSPTPDAPYVEESSGAIDLYKIYSDGTGEFINGYTMGRFTIPQKADPAMVRLAQELETKNCKGHIAEADLHSEYQGEWVHSRCVSLFDGDTIRVEAPPE